MIESVSKKENLQIFDVILKKIRKTLKLEPNLNRIVSKVALAQFTVSNCARIHQVGTNYFVLISLKIANA